MFPNMDRFAALSNEDREFIRNHMKFQLENITPDSSFHVILDKDLDQQAMEELSYKIQFTLKDALGYLPKCILFSTPGCQYKISDGEPKEN